MFSDKRSYAYETAVKALHKTGSETKNRTVIAYSLKNSGYQTSATVTGQLGATFVENYTTDCDTSGISLVFANYYGDKIGDNNISIKVGVKVRGVFYPIFFNGRRTMIIEPGGDIESDILGVSVSRNEIISVHTLATVSELGNTIPRGITAIAMKPGMEDLTLSELGEGETTGYGYSPLMVRGAVVSANKKPTIVLYGASSFAGTGDGTTGFGLRSLMGAYPFYRVAKGGEYISNITFPRLSLAKYADIALLYVGSNEVYRGNSLSAIKSDIIGLANYLTNMGLKVYACTVNGRTNSTDKWYTVENQTWSGGSYTPGGLLDQVNEWLRGVPQPLYGVYDVWAAVESSPGSGKWIPHFTGDGIHGSPAGYARMASVLRAGLSWMERGERMTTPLTFNYPQQAVDSFDGRNDATYLGFADTGQAWLTRYVDGWGTTADGKARVTTTSQEYAVLDLLKPDCIVESSITYTTECKVGHALRFNARLDGGYCWRTNNTGGGQIIFSRRVGGTAAVVSTIPTPLKAGTTYRMKSVVSGNSIKVYVDNQLVVDYAIPESDRTPDFLAGTYHGMYSNGDNGSDIDNFKAY